MARQRTINRRTTERLIQVVKDALAERELTATEAAREAKLPANAFRALLSQGHRPTLDRADELCRAVGAKLILGDDDPSTEHEP